MASSIPIAMSIYKLTALTKIIILKKCNHTF